MENTVASLDQIGLQHPSDNDLASIGKAGLSGTTILKDLQNTHV